MENEKKNRKFYVAKTRVGLPSNTLDEARRVAHDLHGWHVLGLPPSGRVIEALEDAPANIVAWCVRGERRAAIRSYPAGFDLEEFEVRVEAV